MDSATEEVLEGDPEERSILEVQPPVSLISQGSHVHKSRYVARDFFEPRSWEGHSSVRHCLIHIAGLDGKFQDCQAS